MTNGGETGQPRSWSRRYGLVSSPFVPSDLGTKLLSEQRAHGNPLNVPPASHIQGPSGAFRDVTRHGVKKPGSWSAHPTVSSPCGRNPAVEPMWVPPAKANDVPASVCDCHRPQGGTRSSAGRKPRRSHHCGSPSPGDLSEARGPTV